MKMRTLRSAFALALAAILALIPVAPVAAQQPIVFFRNVDAVSGQASATVDDTPCVLVKYVGSTTGKPTVEVAAGGDLTFKIAGSADTTTGSPSLDGIFDLSTPAAAVDTYGEFVNLVNTTGSNWRAVLVACLASDLTNNTLDDIAATDASNPKGVALTREATSASATSVFSAQVAALPPGVATDIRFFLSGSPVGNTTGSAKVNPNPFGNYQTFIQNIREKITSAGTVALFEVLGVTRTYDSSGKVTETVRPVWAETGAATTVEKAKDFNSGPLVMAKGELVIVRQRTATDLTAINLGVNGYTVRQQ
jgi:hypothetical protein